MSDLPPPYRSFLERSDETGVWTQKRVALYTADQVLAAIASRDEEITRLRKDSHRLLFIKDMVDSIGGIDLHEEAAINASAFGREEPNDDDYLAAIRTAIDAALKEKE